MDVDSTVSNAWLRTMQTIFGVPSIERTRMAMVSVDSSIREIANAQEKLKGELFDLAVSVRQKQSLESRGAGAVKVLLQRSRLKRLQLASLHKKQMLLESQKDVLTSNDLNQQVFHSMQHTSIALKSMGLNETMNNVDEIMTDISDSTDEVRAIQDGLSNDSLGHGEVSEADLAEELRFLMEDDLDITSMISQAPATANKMQHEKPAATVTTKITTALPVVEEEPRAAVLEHV